MPDHPWRPNAGLGRPTAFDAQWADALRQAGGVPGEAAITWAHAFLQPLQLGTDRTVHQSLRAWIEAGTDAQRTAQNLGISRTTVRAHLHTAEQRLKRSLQTPGPGTHELIHAFRIADRAP